MSQYPPIQIVDENDNPIGSTSMHDAYDKGLIHRIVHVIVEDQNGRILLQKRSDKVATAKNCWDISVGGHVDEGESYEEAALRELREELGFDQSVHLEPLDKFYADNEIDGRRFKRFIMTFKAHLEADTEFHPEPEEVSELKWFEPVSVEKLATEHPELIANGIRVYLRYLKHENNQHQAAS